MIILLMGGGGVLHLLLAAAATTITTTTDTSTTSTGTLSSRSPQKMQSGRCTLHRRRGAQHRLQLTQRALQAPLRCARIHTPLKKLRLLLLFSSSSSISGGRRSSIIIIVVMMIISRMIMIGTRRRRLHHHRHCRCHRIIMMMIMITTSMMIMITTITITQHHHYGHAALFDSITHIPAPLLKQLVQTRPRQRRRMQRSRVLQHDLRYAPEALREGGLQLGRQIRLPHPHHQRRHIPMHPLAQPIR